MSDVRQLLERAVGWFEPAEPDLASIARRARRSTVRRRVVAGVVGAVLFIAAGAFVITAFGTGPGHPVDVAVARGDPRLTVMRDLDRRIVELRSARVRAAERYRRLLARRTNEEAAMAHLLARLDEPGLSDAERTVLEDAIADRLPPLELLRERCEDLLGTVARLDRDLQEAIDDREAFVESLGDDVIFFPTYEPTMFMQALLDGQVLDARRGCLFAGDALLVWPEAFTFDRRAVVDLDTDEVVYRLGDEASLGGGLVDPAYAEDLIGEPIPAVCRGGPESVWLVGEVLVERTAP